MLLTRLGLAYDRVAPGVPPLAADDTARPPGVLGRIARWLRGADRR